MPPKDKDSKPVVKGKGNLMKIPTKGELDKDASILALRWTWRSSSSAGAVAQHVAWWLRACHLQWGTCIHVLTPGHGWQLRER